ncbi:glycosyltransferase [Winogradskyella sp. SYSU M77433]|uniref:glycosyltransferase n=1 Tax=Winogradskyella sp. SYSU M77433 TaxID=3042722 RepID=UPI0024808923|nr:glycosyltransferase [Winogradskyella sp. SYSU M77433]MDH7913959.1 glycosyltransferase [Winogradskyella sp. SYSU M77433]
MNNSKKNISILSITLGSGGAEKVISLLLKSLVKDYNVYLVLFYDNIHFSIPEGVNVVFLSEKGPERPFYLKTLDSIKFIFKYFKFVKRNNIIVSVSFLAFPNLINGVVSTLNKRVKTIISERGFPSDNVSSKLSLYISKIFYPIFYNRCDKLFSNSIHINNDLKNNFGIKIPMEVIYNPIEIPQKTIEPTSLNSTEKRLEIITAGTLNTRKNQVMIIRSLLEIQNNDKFTILGDGHLRAYLTEEIKSSKLENQVQLKGKVKNVNDFLLESNCFVLSSFTEGFPNALLEAMAIGLPCISTNCLSGPLELLNENDAVDIKNGEFVIAKYGLLVNNDDHVGLSKALDFYRNSPEKRVEFGKLSLQRAKEYHLDTIYTKFNQFITN